MVMLGSECNPCCKQQPPPYIPCAACETGKLPDTLTVTITIDPDTYWDAVTASATSCSGSGATIRFDEPSGRPSDVGYPETKRGALASPVVTSGGSGYAVIARVEPTLSVTGGNDGGTGGTFAITLTKTDGECCDPYWSIKSIKASGDVSDYGYGEQLTIEDAEGDTTTAGAVARIYAQGPPTLTATVDRPEEIGGATDATLTVNLYPVPPNTPPWTVQSVTVNGGGTDYIDESAVTFTLGDDDVEVSPATAIARTTLLQPVGTFSVQSATGAGATFLAPTYTAASPKGWQIPGQFLDQYINAAGTGYELDDPVVLTFDEGTTVIQEIVAYVDLLGPNGEIEGIVLENPGRFWLDNGIVSKITMTNLGGSYYKEDTPTVVVFSGGQYHREDASLPGCAPAITFAISQVAPSDGSGAELEATVDTDPDSETFGQITEVTVTDGGDGYLAKRLVSECYERLNGVEIVLPRLVNGQPCSYELSNCFYTVQAVYTDSFSNNNVPQVSLISPYETILMNGTEPVLSCDDLEFTAEYQGTTASVTPGGEYTGDVPYPYPETVTITISHTAPDLVTALQGFGDGMTGSIVQCDDPDSSLGVTRNQRCIIQENSCTSTPGEEEFPLDASGVTASCESLSTFKESWCSSSRFQTDGVPNILDTSVPGQGAVTECAASRHYASDISKARMNCIGGGSLSVAWSCAAGGGSLVLEEQCPNKRFQSGAGFALELQHVVSWSPLEIERVHSVTDPFQVEEFTVTVTITE